MTDIQLEKYTDKSTFIWGVNNIKLPKNAPWNFEDRRWQLQIMDDPSKQICVRKPTQVGLSTVMLTKMLHFADMHQARAVMTLPRQDDVYDMVNSRLAEIISESPYIYNKMVGVDNVRMKRFGKSWLHFVEMSVPPRMMDVDWMLNDEVDLSNMEYLEQAVSRMDASQYGYHHRISTPSMHDYGIDALYQFSDKKEWFVTCAYCSHEQTLNWFANVANDNSKTWYKCSRCGNQLHAQDIREGRWIATGNTNSDISGYQITQLMCTYIDPNKLWVQYKTLSPKNFYNFRLGLPYAQTSGGFDRNLVMENCFLIKHKAEERPMKGATYVLGCDQGNVLHYVIGEAVEGSVRVVKAGVIPFELGFQELGRLIELFNIKMAVIDGLPNHHSSRQLVADFPNRSVTAYFHNIEELYRAKEEEQRVVINKTDAYDLLFDKVSKSELQLYSTDGMVPIEIDSIITHMTNMRRDVEEQKSKIGGVKTFHVWKNVGPDHYADALLYAVIAADIISGKQTGLDIVDLGGAMNSFGYNIHNVSADPEKLYGILTGENNYDNEDLEPSLTRLNSSEKKEPDFLVPANPYMAKKEIGRIFGIF